MAGQSSSGGKGVPGKAHSAARIAKYKRYAAGRGEKNKIKRIERHLKQNPLDAASQTALLNVRKYGLTGKPGASQ